MSGVETQKKKLVLSDIEVWEYGYSKVLWELCPQGWKNPLGDEWEDVLAALIRKWPPRTYLGLEHDIRDPGTFHCSFGAQGGHAVTPYF